MNIREYREEDFNEIHLMNDAEGWSNLVARGADTKTAWANSTIAYVAEENGEIIGCVWGFTDTKITTYICELIIQQNFRGKGIGTKLLRHVHSLYPETRMELLASSTSKTYYEQLNFRPFYGYRKTFEEWS
ncbi:GNAT family N-acetyltransferase [Chungangia koreensis]|uniref:GNAT family N-acetyltransferase n=1 Tax=Chungangia koreensis TaxID=752657 RepID=A0ABV8WZ17_9LACT